MKNTAHATDPGLYGRVTSVTGTSPLTVDISGIDVEASTISSYAPTLDDQVFVVKLGTSRQFLILGAVVSA